VRIVVALRSKTPHGPGSVAQSARRWLTAQSPQGRL
jgi:hypothetical protein